jgi:hypothetical protein
VDRGHNFENICIGLFHVSGHLGGIYLLVKTNNFGGMGRPLPPPLCGKFHQIYLLFYLTFPKLFKDIIYIKCLFKYYLKLREVCLVIIVWLLTLKHDSFFNRFCKT